MWCERCQSEVAAEVSPDNQRVFCAACGTVLSTIDAPPVRPVANKLGDRAKDARELLQRWSSGKVADPFGPPILTSSAIPEPSPIAIAQPTEPTIPAALSDSTSRTIAALEESTPRPTGPKVLTLAVPELLFPKNPTPAPQASPADVLSTLADRMAPTISNPLAAQTEPTPSVTISTSSPFVNTEAPSTSNAATPLNPLTGVVPSSPVFRVDAAHPAVQFASSAKSPNKTNSDAVGPFASKAPKEPEATAKRTRAWFPTWDPAVWRSEPSASGSWSSMAGQFLAYAGVLGMTAGACMVVWSYFGGPAQYAPTGWLLATAGQMLLFFGVVTLVSGGLEQTTEQVNKRIEQLGDHIIRIEQAAREMNLRGGSIPPAHFGHDHDAVMPVRSAASGYERSVVEE